MKSMACVVSLVKLLAYYRMVICSPDQQEAVEMSRA